MRLLLYLAFVLSGGAGLLYELAWSRYLALFVGHSAYAQVLVIAVYLGGMAVGALAVGDRARRLRRPLLWYGGAEIFLGVMGTAFHPLFQAATGGAYDVLFPALVGSPLLGLAKWSLAILLILPQAVVLGTTFPLISSGVLRAFPDHPGGKVAVLYFVNSLGGAVGVLVGGFGLVAWVGLPGVTLAGAGLNAVAAFLAVAVAASMGHRSLSGHQLEDRLSRGPVPAGPEAPGESLWRPLLAVAFGTAVASFIYQIAWIRMLSLVMGSATHSFELMLSAFILGLALGALLVRKLADGARRPLRLLAGIQWLMGFTALATLPVYLVSFRVMSRLVTDLPATEAGYHAFNLARYGIAMGVMLPSTILAGMTLPLITSILLHRGQGERSVGWVYGVNTFGSVTGVVAAGLILLPLLGLKGMLIGGAVLDMGLGAYLLVRARGGEASLIWRPATAVIATVTVAVGVGVGIQMSRALLLGGVFRHGSLPPGDRNVLFYEDGRTATVGAHVDEANDLVSLTTNGKPDASLGRRWIRAAAEPLPPRPIRNQDESTQVVAALTTLAHVPDARRGVAIGHGSGVSGHFLLASPRLEELVTAEIEPQMVNGSRVYYPANARVFDDSRHRFVIDDARSYLASRSRERYDFVFSEPSNPWVSGAASLFTVEFYRRAGRYLADDGVFAQWIQLYEISDRLVLSALAAIHESFVSYRAFLVGDTDLLIVASNQPELPAPDWSVYREPQAAEDLSHVPEFTDAHLDATWLFDRQAVAPLLEAWEPVNSDFRPVLDLGTEKTRFLNRFASGVYGLATDRFDVAGALTDHPSGFAGYSVPPVWGLPPMRGRALAAWLREERGRPEAERIEIPDPTYARGLAELRSFQEELRAGEPPESWREWVGRVASLEGDLHAETAGVADSAFFGMVRRYLRGQNPPDRAVDAVAFLEGIAAWDWGSAAAAGNRLVESLAGGPSWLRPALLLDGVVVANLKAGEPEAAATALEALDPRTDRDPGDFRVLLLRAWVERALGGRE